MKTLLISVCLLWTTLAAELASGGKVPHGALLLPLVCGLIFWMRSTGGLVLCGLALLVDWIARPTSLPLCSMVLPLLSVLCIAPGARNEDYRRTGLSLRIPSPLQLPLFTVAALLLHNFGAITFAQVQTPSMISAQVTESFVSLAVIALPVSALFSLMIHAADELGLRRTFMF
jgi:hypothetical protein